MDARHGDVTVFAVPNAPQDQLDCLCQVDGAYSDSQNVRAGNGGMVGHLEKTAAFPRRFKAIVIAKKL
jgi:hypothetical protein